ncbi:hypothetical protein B0T17DRAFT_515706 [Bombardia bombarda]|uniref:Secreted protein n=1 Tax=Bombardia bombarda TaxID=252184 RepID=A0AA39XJL5_9PEZI|nr:hypothetical protein B0T17DRAFT_515706 [Bombardia bombarda]
MGCFLAVIFCLVRSVCGVCYKGSSMDGIWRWGCGIHIIHMFIIIHVHTFIRTYLHNGAWMVHGAWMAGWNGPGNSSYFI